MDPNELPPETPVEPVVVRYSTDGSDPASPPPIATPVPNADRAVDQALAQVQEEGPQHLSFLTPEEADTTYWPNLPMGGKFLPVRRQQYLRNPRRNLRREIGKLFGSKLSGRQWVKRRKQYYKHIAAGEGISRQEMKRRERGV